MSAHIAREGLEMPHQVDPPAQGGVPYCNSRPRVSRADEFTLRVPLVPGPSRWGVQGCSWVRRTGLWRRGLEEPWGSWWEVSRGKVGRTWCGWSSAQLASLV